MLRAPREAQMPTPRRMHMKRIWMIQKGMRTAFNQGDWRGGFLVVDDFAIAAALLLAADMMISSEDVNDQNLKMPCRSSQKSTTTIKTDRQTRMIYFDYT